MQLEICNNNNLYIYIYMNRNQQNKVATSNKSKMHFQDNLGSV